MACTSTAEGNAGGAAAAVDDEAAAPARGKDADEKRRDNGAGARKARTIGELLIAWLHCEFCVQYNLCRDRKIQI